MAESRSDYLAQLPSTCCIGGSIHEGTPIGSEEQVAGITTYVARPPTGVTANGNVVFFLPDIWGLANNSKLLIDGFAAAGYVALGMDYFRGDPISKYRSSHDAKPPPDFDMEAWRVKHFSFATDNVPVWVDAAKTIYGTTGSRYGCVGYCFGAPFVANLLAGDAVSAGAVAHPTQLKEGHFRAVKKPLFLSCAEHDRAFGPEPRRRAIDILQETKVSYHLQLFCNVNHGFASRGNLTDLYEKWVKEQSHRGITDWFNFWLSQN
ncbi:dienelactone hydrolase [Grosmannia clavigera kw1407]|uniref:Dienelactone hydrolase n=1 Tax=Grosmannia clavigera (strain kw1407 / UAMH 11150) TaxID=655863 RepID=F0XCM7_GROCL|nr:dienelactone hydrolase [Grosmannia clavigera kw1407]EFX04117.1 dienelactone hydrolase [Grosmannia clavigera kw1407]